MSDRLLRDLKNIVSINSNYAGDNLLKDLKCSQFKHCFSKFKLSILEKQLQVVLKRTTVFGKPPVSKESHTISKGSNQPSFTHLNLNISKQTWSNTVRIYSNSIHAEVKSSFSPLYK